MQLPARITVREASAAVRELSSVLAGQPAGAVVEVDASGLQQFDSSALAVLIDMHRQAAAGGRSLHIGGLPQRLDELARVYGVADLVSSGRQADGNQGAA
ncbi:STAS domain-containing protein [uncultured Sphaerotilus sp.]|uniref:STAS domain-containing protein n=1 Tax=uncultured Sphaerotilus sp. TaxID=474984 RepID=UPI0030CA30BA